VSPFRLSAKETAQFVRKLAKSKDSVVRRGRTREVDSLSNLRDTGPYKRGNEPSLDEIGSPAVANDALAGIKPRRHGIPRMPADSHREECRCGIVMKFSWTDEAFANKFIAIWWKRHSGKEHGRVCCDKN
jgi:hypothetical protein